MPGDEISRGVVQSFGRPLLVSSANLARKHGERSVAQVRKNFGRTVDLMIDAGDLGEGPKSTLVDLTKGRPSVIRIGVVSEETIQQVLA
jgi:L-threonylcarbamoyladenylate synthase